MYFVHNDHLSTPKLLTDITGSIVWEQHTTPFGEVHSEITTGVNNLKAFPGQYADDETGLSYNYFRDYDPTIGRYIQSDPIGLNGGLNTYGYVEGNPITNYDPNGLTSLSLCANPANAASCFSAGIIPNKTTSAAVIAVGAANHIAGENEEDCPGTATGDPRCDELNKRVQETKKPIEAFGKGNASCKPGMTKEELVARKAAWLAHATARALSGQVCWNGGNLGHQQAQSDAWRHVAKCGALLQ